MLFYLTVIFVCQLIGEAVVTVLVLPIPGPVLGMALLFAGLMVKGSVPGDLGRVGDSLLKHLSLLFIPAGVGVMLHAELLKREIVPLSVALIVSTLLAIAVTGLLMSWLSKGETGERPQ